MTEPMAKEEARNLPLAELCRRLDTSIKGLTSTQARKKLLEFGPNKIIIRKQKSIIVKFLQNLNNFFSGLLFFASILLFISGLPNLGVIFIVIILANAGFTLYQEAEAEKELKALKGWVPSLSKVFRDDALQKIPVEDLVPGDLILLEEGDRIPADARIIEAHNFATIEIPLTGEYTPQTKHVSELNEYNGQKYQNNNEKTKDKEIRASKSSPEELSVPNLVYMSTLVARGQAKAIIFGTGMNTTYGMIAHLTQVVKPPKSPLQREISYIGKYSLVLSFLVGGIFFIINLFILNAEFVASIMFIIGVMIACVPEGLQATISSALAINASNMAREGILVQRLSAVQTLGSVTLICTDKTGTITKGEMTVNKIWVSNKTIDVSGIGYHPKGDFREKGRLLFMKESKDVEFILKISALCNSAKLQSPHGTEKNWSVLGDPTDGALLIAATKYGLNPPKLLKSEPLINFFPFDSNRLMMSSVHAIEGGLIAYIKGAPRQIFSKATHFFLNGKVVPLKDLHMQWLALKLNEFANQGLRIIAVGFRELPASFCSNELIEDDIERNITLVGLIAMKDPPRLEVQSAIKQARRAGIKVAMITGDYKGTAKAIAQEVGIINQHDTRTVIKGKDLRNMPESEIMTAIKKSGTVFARVSPEDKLRIVSLAVDNGEIVAVTGDGANDAPALRKASVGVGMGLSGTDIAKESADLVLLDDNFATIIKAVESGRTIWDNLKKYIYYVYTHNWAELLPYILYIFLILPLPILVMHIILIDLIIDVIPSLALSRDHPEPDIMDQPPRNVSEHLFKFPVFLYSLTIGFIIGAFGFSLCLFSWIQGGWQYGQPLDLVSSVYLRGTSILYASIVIGQIANLISCRKDKVSLFSPGIRRNKWIYFSICWQIGILAITLYLPIFNFLFQTAPLTLVDWLWIFNIFWIVIIMHEIWKSIARRNSYVKK